jgi:hypothetical protein
MTGFTDPFGGNTLQPAYASYNSLSMTASTTLAWPATALDGNFLARIMDLESFSVLYTLTFPSAQSASVGWDSVLTNIGSYTITVLKADGLTTLCTLPAGTSWYIYLIDNSTANGTWRATQLASTTSTVSAASLVGPGIAAAGASLYNARATIPFSASYLVQTYNRTNVYSWTGGVGTLSLPTASAAGGDFFISVTNQGTGVLTIDPNGVETINGSATLNLAIGDSCDVYSNGASAWYTVGLGRSTLFNFTLLSKAVATGTYTLSISEASNVLQKYTGVLVANVIIVLPSTIQVYYISNQTSGAFTLTFKTAGVGTTVVVPTNQSSVIFCDGTNVVNASTAIGGVTAMTLAQGGLGTPSLNYVADLTTGMYSPAAGSIAWQLTGAAAMTLSGAGLALVGAVTATTGVTPATSQSTLTTFLDNQTWTVTVSGTTVAGAEAGGQTGVTYQQINNRIVGNAFISKTLTGATGNLQFVLPVIPAHLTVGAVLGSATGTFGGVAQPTNALIVWLGGNKAGFKILDASTTNKATDVAVSASLNSLHINLHYCV